MHFRLIISPQYVNGKFQQSITDSSVHFQPSFSSNFIEMQAIPFTHCQVSLAAATSNGKFDSFVIIDSERIN